ncbi:hypothetical protein D3C87_1783860 [compost metagenome]
MIGSGSGITISSIGAAGGRAAPADAATVVATVSVAGAAFGLGTPTKKESLNTPISTSSPEEIASSKTAWPFLKVPD